MKIEKDIYQGYIWTSDSDGPIVIDDKEFELEIEDNAIPFVVEGMLATKSKSIAIKYVDGKHRIVVTDLDLDGEYDEVTFAAHRMEGIKGLQFRRYWKEVENDLCLGMKELVPANLVFVGFNK